MDSTVASFSVVSLPLSYWVELLSLSSEGISSADAKVADVSGKYPIQMGRSHTMQCSSCQTKKLVRRCV